MFQHDAHAPLVSPLVLVVLLLVGLVSVARFLGLDVLAEIFRKVVEVLSPFARQGNLMIYGPVLEECYRRLAVYVDKIRKGARPGDLPIELPTKVELVINLKTASRIGVTIPQALLLRADELIK